MTGARAPGLGRKLSFNFLVRSADDTPNGGERNAMQLPVQLYSEVVTELKLLGYSAGSEKRRSARIEVKANVQVGTLRGVNVAQIFSVLTRDISQTGIGLLVAQPLADGEKFLLELPKAKSGKVLVVTAAMHNRVMANGIFAIGAEFIAPAPAELIREWEDYRASATDRLRNVILT